MIKVDRLTKHLGLFISIYLVIVLFSLWHPVSNFHNAYFCKVGKGFFNAVNINLHSEWIPKAPTNPKNWNTTINLYSLEKYGQRVTDRRYRNQVQPTQKVYNNFYTIAFLPLLFLIALYIVTPELNAQEKLWRFVISWIILNIFIAFQISHMIENVMANNGEVGDSFWQQFIALLGFYGLEEGLYIIASVSWAVMVIPRLRPMV